MGRKSKTKQKNLQKKSNHNSETKRIHKKNERNASIFPILLPLGSGGQNEKLVSHSENHMKKDKGKIIYRIRNDFEFKSGHENYKCLKT